MRLVAAVSVSLALAMAAAGGPLNPPAGPIASTQKPLGEVEPRTAVNATNTPGDSTAVYVISQSGSYYLTGNVTGVSGKSGVRITADHVTLDLNGFSVTGVPGAHVGVGEPGTATRVNVCVKNGVVQGWPDGGVHIFQFSASSGTRYENLTVVGNGVGSGGNGLECRDSSTIVNCVSRGNEGKGFACADGNVLVNCVSVSNGIGFETGFGNQLTSCVARQNLGNGFVGGTADFTGCNSTLNGGDGYVSSFRGTYCESMADGNNGWGFNVISSANITGCSAAGNNAGGVQCSTGCTVRDCTVQTLAIGIRANGTACRIEGNTVFGGTVGFDIQGSNHFVVSNTCRGSTTRFSISGTHTYGPIITATGVITTTSPYANFEF